MENVIWFDIITIALILILAIKGIINGFIKEVFGLIGIIGGIYLASRFANLAGKWVNENIFVFDKDAIFIVGFLSVLLAFWISSVFLGMLTSKLVSLSGLGTINKMAGFFVGGAKIFFVFSVLFLALSHVEFAQEHLNKYVKNSVIYPSFIKTGAFIVNIKTSDIKAINPIDIKISDDKLDQQKSSETTDQNTEATTDNDAS